MPGQEDLPAFWEEANLAERRKLLTVALDSDYGQTVKEKSIAANGPKPALKNKAHQKGLALKPIKTELFCLKSPGHGLQVHFIDALIQATKILD